MPRLLSRLPTSTLMGLAFTVPAGLIAGLLLYYHSIVAQRYLAEEGIRFGSILADQILTASERFLGLGSLSAVQEMVEDTGSNRSVIHVALIGGDGRIIASNRREWIDQDDGVIDEPAYGEVAAEARVSFTARHRVVEGGRHIILVSPLLAQGASPILLNPRRGLLYLKVDQQRKLWQIYRGILMRGGLSAFGILLVSLLLFLWMRAILARPILSVAAYLRAFDAGDGDRPPPVRGPKEVSQLIADVRHMTRDMRDKQAALAASEQRHRGLLEGAHDAILTADPQTGLVVEVNGMFCRMFGYRPEEARRLGLMDLHPPEERDRLGTASGRARGPGHLDLQDVPCVRKGGERFLVDIRGGPIELGGRTIHEWILRDTTERRALETQVRQAQKMEGVANLAGAVAHDFNNLLTGILGYARLVLDRMSPEPAIRRPLEAIERSAARAAELTANLLTFSRRAASRPVPTDLNRVVTDSIRALRGILSPAIDLELRCEPRLWTTAVDGGQIRQVLLHLGQNAGDAMPQGGRLTIATANREISEEDCRSNLEARGGRFVTLTVADTGEGIPPEIRSRLFEPFFSTKKRATASGLGLATVYGTVKGHEGWVEIDSAVGRGAAFTVFLPVWDPVAGEARLTAAEAKPAAMDAPPAAAPAAAARGGAADRRTILAVDDESTVLALAKDVLELSGYHVLTARNGEEALRLFRGQPLGIDLVLLDLTMPVMGGLECFRRMRDINPHVRVVISSGFSSESSVSEVLSEGALDFVQKPYDINLLANTIEAVLSRSVAPTLS